MSSGKTTKYLKYAIGEIILVVIGILIALSINNWNADRIQSNREQAYLENIHRDFQTQLQAIDAQIIYESQIIKTTSKLIISYKKEQKFLIDSAFTSDIGKITGRMTFSKHNSTYVELLSSGNLDILSNREFKNDYIKFNQGLERTEIVLNKNNAFVDEVLTPDLLQITETQLSSIFELDSFKDVFDQDDAFFKNFNIDLNEERLKEITKEQLAIPKNELIMINEINYRNRIAMVGYQFLNTQKELLLELQDNLISILKVND